MNQALTEYAKATAIERRNRYGNVFKYLLATPGCLTGKLRPRMATYLESLADIITTAREWVLVDANGKLVATSETGVKLDMKWFDDSPDSDDEDIDSDDESVSVPAGDGTDSAAADGALTYDDDESGFHAYASADAEGDDWVSEYLEMYEYNRRREEESAAEVVSAPVRDDTDSAANSESWRAETIQDALDEDDALFEASLDTPEAHAAMMEVVHDAYDALETFYLATARRSVRTFRRRYMREQGKLYVSDGRRFSYVRQV